MVQPCATKFIIMHMYSVTALDILGGIKCSSAAYHTSAEMRLICKLKAKQKNKNKIRI